MKKISPAIVAVPLSSFLSLASLGVEADTFCPDGVRACPPEPALEKKLYGGQQSFTGEVFGDLIKDKEALIALGKALFWDE